VSIAWNYVDVEDTVMMFLEQDMLTRDEKYQTEKYAEYENRRTWTEIGVENYDEYGLEHAPTTGSQVTSDQLATITKDFKLQELVDTGAILDERWKQWQVAEKKDFTEDVANPIRRRLHRTELALIGGKETSLAESAPEKQVELLKSLKSSSSAFVVFNTTRQRDEAVGKDMDKKFRESDLKLEEIICEPDTVNWQNFNTSTAVHRFGRILAGFGKILLALFFWTIVFYAPYAYQVFCFNYDNGAQPGPMLAFAFGMVVVVGNAIMCEVCAHVSDSIGFKTRDARESCYMILYVVACMFNVGMDMVTTYCLAEYVLDGLGFRTYHGVRFDDVPTFTERFETYAMQRMLAENTRAYAFPASFLIPFLIEPFITIIFPYLGGKLLVGIHKEWVGRDAEKMLVAFEFDMGRYGDLLLNMMLAMLIFFFPGGYTLLLFFGMAGSHCYIYMFDHVRVLRTIPKCMYATMNVDWWGTWMMCPITAMIPMCLVFKANCQGYGFCLKGMALIEAEGVTYVLHALVHTLLLVFLVPKFQPKRVVDENDDKTFADTASSLPCTWFTSNPIHSLRSQHLHNLKDKPYCSFFHNGKAHLLNHNPDIGLHYQGEEATGEDYSKKKKMSRKKSSSLK